MTRKFCDRCGAEFKPGERVHECVLDLARHELCERCMDLVREMVVTPPPAPDDETKVMPALPPAGRQPRRRGRKE